MKSASATSSVFDFDGSECLNLYQKHGNFELPGVEIKTIEDSFGFL